MPPDETYWCEYAQDWAEIKGRWDLTMTEPEAEAVALMLGTCEDPPDVDVREALESARKRSSRGSRGSRGARAEAWVTRRRWSRQHGTVTETEWCASDNGPANYPRTRLIPTVY